MYAIRKSDKVIVVKKQANKVIVMRTAESVERRTLTKRNSVTALVTRTQSLGQTMSSLHRIRKTAKENRTLRFNNLLHHITPELLKNAYDNLNKKAARGVDGETWQSYGQGLTDKLQNLHVKIHTGRYKPQPSKRIWLLKPDGRQRPIGIAVVE